MTCPLPHYWMCHIAIAQIIALAMWWPFGFEAGQAIGATFYIGREVRDYEKLGAWDWPGLIAPVAACAAVLVVYRIISLQ